VKAFRSWIRGRLEEAGTSAAED